MATAHFSSAFGGQRKKLEWVDYAFPAPCIRKVVVMV